MSEGSRRFEYTVSRISQDLWFKYFDGILSTAERCGKEVVQRVDTSTAGLELVDQVVAREEGIRIPLQHKLTVVNVLTSAYVPDQEMQGFGQVPLIALWSAGASGALRRHKDLVHVFEEPTAEQNRRYRRDDSRAQIIGGSRKGTTVFRGAQRTLAALYDELIVSVAGYAVNGVALEGREEIARHMDTYHKVAAVARLFVPQDPDLEEDEEE
jgi:hypothetical protein